METPTLELRPLGRDAKSLKHKHKSPNKCAPPQEPLQETCGGPSDASNSAEPKRSSSGSSPGRCCAPTNKRAAAAVCRDDTVRELLAGKIAELEVGGDETLDDLSGRSQ